MEQTYTFRRGQTSDIKEISNLVNQVLGFNRISQYWEWKYFKSPAGRALSPLALNNGKIIGQIGGVPIRFSVRGRESIGVQEVDIAMFEPHRRYDLFLKMGRLGAEICLKENVGFSYGFSIGLTSEIAQTLTLKKKICPIPRLVKLLDVEPILRQRFSMNTLSKILSPAANLALEIRYPEKMVIPEGLQIKKIQRFDERFDTFWNRIKEDYPIMAMRDSASLNWRYADTPHIDYEIVCVEQMKTMEILGFIVLGERQFGFLRGRIFDIITPRSEDGKVARCLLRYAINHFRKKKAAMATCWMFSHCHVYPELTKIGFMPRQEKGKDLLFESLNLQDPVIPEYLAAKAENWYISMGDSDMD
jgi:hypothetical protein